MNCIIPTKTEGMSRRLLLLSAATTLYLCILGACVSFVDAEILGMRNANGAVDPDSLDPATQKLVQEQYDLFMKGRREEKAKKQQQEEQRLKEQEPKLSTPTRKGISPKQLGLKRNPSTSKTPLTEQVDLEGGTYFFGTQMTIDKGGKIAPTRLRDGADYRKKVTTKPFSIDVDCVTNDQFAAFIRATKYETEAELFGWSFVLDSLASEDIIDDVDGEFGYGRVKGAEHWMAVKGASWNHPFGPDSSLRGLGTHPVVQVSYQDAVEYCAWLNEPEPVAAEREDGPPSSPLAVVRKYRLPTEKEWEFAARGGLVNMSYPWGDAFLPRHANIWEGDFPKVNTVIDGFHGVAPVKSFKPNSFGVYNMVGNVWEWVAGGTPERRVIRGGSFIDSQDGQFNHAVRVSTRDENTADSAGVNVGFRCASTMSAPKPPKKALKTKSAVKEEEEEKMKEKSTGTSSSSSTTETTTTTTSGSKKSGTSEKAGESGHDNGNSDRHHHSSNHDDHIIEL